MQWLRKRSKTFDTILLEFPKGPSPICRVYQASLHWLHVHFRMDDKIVMSTFKACLGLTPNYFGESMIQAWDPGRLKVKAVLFWNDMPKENILGMLSELFGVSSESLLLQRSPSVMFHHVFIIMFKGVIGIKRFSAEDFIKWVSGFGCETTKTMNRCASLIGLCYSLAKHSYLKLNFHCFKRPGSYCPRQSIWAWKDGCRRVFISLAAAFCSNSIWISAPKTDTHTPKDMDMFCGSWDTHMHHQHPSPRVLAWPLTPRTRPRPCDEAS